MSNDTLSHSSVLISQRRFATTFFLDYKENVTFPVVMGVGVCLHLHTHVRTLYMFKQSGLCSVYSLCSITSNSDNRCSHSESHDVSVSHPPAPRWGFRRSCPVGRAFSQSVSVWRGEAHLPEPSSKPHGPPVPQNVQKPSREVEGAPRVHGSPRTSQGPPHTHSGQVLAPLSFLVSAQGRSLPLLCGAQTSLSVDSVPASREPGRRSLPVSFRTTECSGSNP